MVSWNSMPFEPKARRIQPQASISLPLDACRRDAGAPRPSVSFYFLFFMLSFMLMLHFKLKMAVSITDNSRFRQEAVKFLSHLLLFFALIFMRGLQLSDFGVTM